MIRKIITAFLLLVTAFTLYIYLQFFSPYVFPWNKKEAIQTALKWGGLAPLPAPVKDIDVKKQGSAFTREYIIEFTASEKQIDDWIHNSKRLKNNMPKQTEEKKIYNITPGEAGSYGGNVEINNNKATIDLSWS